ncbi:MAG: DUF72 domain-containing protein [Hyphomicrobiaceae bacterium]
MSKSPNAGALLAERQGIWVGTSGWSYDSWRGPFYEPQTPKKDWLQSYGATFPTTEINASFYRTPSVEAVHAWREKTPSRFTFAWKASKFITHWKRLNETCKNSIVLMESRLKLLGPKAGPVLFQLPGNFHADRERLARFLRMLSRRHRYAFEFRNASWYTDEIFDLLSKNNISLCIADHHLAPAPWLATAGHVYVRGHGPDGRYRDNYPDATLRQWSRRIMQWHGEGRSVCVYFDNDQKSAAPADAKRLIASLHRRMLREKGRAVDKRSPRQHRPISAQAVRE